MTKKIDIDSDIKLLLLFQLLPSGRSGSKLDKSNLRGGTLIPSKRGHMTNKREYKLV